MARRERFGAARRLGSAAAAGSASVLLPGRRLRLAAAVGFFLWQLSRRRTRREAGGLLAMVARSLAAARLVPAR